MSIHIQATNWELDEDTIFEVSSTDGEVLAIVDAENVQDILHFGFVHNGQLLFLEN